MARHRATRPSVASVMSTMSANGTRTRTKLSYEQNALLALAENSLKRNKKPLNVSAIVKDAERRAHEQGLELGIRARPRIKKAVEKLAEQGAIAEAPRKGRTPAEYRLTPKAVKVYNDAKSHRRSDVGIAKETLDTLKDDVERPNKRRRSSVSAAAASPPRPTQQATITKNLTRSFWTNNSTTTTTTTSSISFRTQILPELRTGLRALHSPLRMACLS
ncbi:hypothetical protein FRC12_018210 [Ceratobasidium sp. 428]|nr:hypothetical protein FRC12_018210 [Ceratobasidium sp. 428]